MALEDTEVSAEAPEWQNLSPPAWRSSLNSGHMPIADDALDEFIEIYKKEFGQDISRDDANEMAFRLVTLYKLLLRKLPHEGKTSSAAKRPSDDRLPIGFRT